MDILNDPNHVSSDENDEAPESMGLSTAKQTHLEQAQAKKSHLKKLKEERKLKNKERNAVFEQRKLDREKAKTSEKETIPATKETEQVEDELPAEVLLAFGQRECQAMQVESRSEASQVTKKQKIDIQLSNSIKFDSDIDSASSDKGQELLGEANMNPRKKSKSSNTTYRVITSSTLPQTPRLSKSASTFLRRQWTKTGHRIAMATALGMKPTGPAVDFLAPSLACTKFGLPLMFRPKDKALKRKRKDALEDLLL